MALNRLQRVLEHEPPLVLSLVGMIAAVAAPTAARWLLTPLLGPALWFATYYPAILFAALLLGWRMGLAALLLSALTADYVFMPPPMTVSLRNTDIAAVLVFLISGGCIVATAALLRQAVHRLNQAAEIQTALNRELLHRVNNNLAVVQALAAQTIRSNPDPEGFYPTFRGRLIALSRAQTVLNSGDWETCEFPGLPESALEPFTQDGRVQLAGPPCCVPVSCCVPLVLALHELGTNAMKYGALSVPQGLVSLRWRPRALEKDVGLVLEWVESGGPQVQPPVRRGLGSRLLSRQGGLDDVVVEYRPEGLRCTILIEGATSDPPKHPLPSKHDLVLSQI